MKCIRFFLLSVVFVLFCYSTVIMAQNSKKYSIKDQLALDIPDAPIISPDGSKILFTMRKADTVNSKWLTQIYLLHVSSGEVKPLTKEEMNASGAQFSPDGKIITFLSARKIKNEKTGKWENLGRQIFAFKGFGDAYPLTNDKNGVDEYTWSPDSKSIAYLNEKQDDDLQNELDRLEEKKIDAKVFPEVKAPKYLNILDVYSTKVTFTQKLDAGAEGISFAPSSNMVIYQSNLTGEYDDEQKFDIYKADFKGTVIRVTTAKGPETNPKYSPTGKWIAFKTQTVPDIEFAKTNLNIMSETGDNIKSLTSNFPYSVDNYVWESDNSLMVTILEKTDIHIYRIDVTTGDITKISKGNTIASDLSITADKNTLCYKLQTGNALPEIALNGLTITDFSRQLAPFSLGKQEPVVYKSRDKKFDLEGVICYPANFDKTKKYPMIVVLHGGPYGNTKNAFLQSLGLRIFASNGYIAFSPNPRGSQGFTDEFSQANRYDLGGGDYNDIVDGVDYLIGQGFVDENKLGVTGGSYGGYLTNWVISQTTRFKAAVSMYGIFSFLTDWSNSWQPAFEPMYFGYNFWQKPIDMNNLYINRSPAFHATKIKTPTLILQGEKDVYTDVANSREMYQTLHALNIPVEFVIYARANHGIRDEPNQYIDVIERSVKWFDKYVK